MEMPRSYWISVLENAKKRLPLNQAILEDLPNTLTRYTRLRELVTLNIESIETDIESIETALALDQSKEWDDE